MAGGSVVPTAEEKADNATSGDPDTYVQKFTPGPKAEKVAGKDDKKDIKDEKKEEKDDKKDEKSESKKKGKLPPWLQKARDKKKSSDSADEDSGEKKESQTESQLRSALKSLRDENEEIKGKFADLEETVKKYHAEINRYKIREARQNQAIVYALALRDLNPEKYAKGEDFLSKVEATVKTMPVDTIETAIAEVDQIRKEKFEAMQSVREAARKMSSDKETSLHTGIVIPRETYTTDNADELKLALMQGTTLGRFMAQAEKYEKEKY